MVSFIIEDYIQMKFISVGLGVGLFSMPQFTTTDRMPVIEK